MAEVVTSFKSGSCGQRENGLLLEHEKGLKQAEKFILGMKINYCRSRSWSLEWQGDNITSKANNKSIWNKLFIFK